jgi:hypothetical protein
MNAETQIYDALRLHAGITAIVGTGAAARIHPDFLAQEIILPAIVYQRAGTEYVTTIHTNAVLAARVALEVWCLHKTRKDAETLADLVEAAIISTELRPVGRRPEFDPETETFSAVIALETWQ